MTSSKPICPSLSFQADAQMENKTVTIKAQIDTIPVKSGHVTCIREGSRR